MKRISIRSIMIFIIAAGISLAAIHSGSRAWSGAMISITFFTMVCSLLGVALTRGVRRIYWSGFATLGWSYLLLMYAPWLDHKVGQFLLAPQLFPYLADVLYSGPQAGGGLQSVPAWPLGAMATGGGFGGGFGGGSGIANLPAFIRIGEAIEALLWAFLGGWVAVYFASGRPEGSNSNVAAPSGTG
jgi:hypothetical protein